MGQTKMVAYTGDSRSLIVKDAEGTRHRLFQNRETEVPAELADRLVDNREDVEIAESGNRTIVQLREIAKDEDIDIAGLTKKAEIADRIDKVRAERAES